MLATTRHPHEPRRRLPASSRTRTRPSAPPRPAARAACRSQTRGAPESRTPLSKSLALPSRKTREQHHHADPCPPRGGGRPCRRTSSEPRRGSRSASASASASWMRRPARQSTTIRPRRRRPWTPSPAWRMTVTISSIVGGLAGSASLCCAAAGRRGIPVAWRVSDGGIEQQLGHGPSSGIGNGPRLLSGAARRRTVTATLESALRWRATSSRCSQSTSASSA